MNIKSIKKELSDMAIKETECEPKIINDMVDLILNKLSDMIFDEGKISDILIINGRSRAKKLSKQGG